MTTTPATTAATNPARPRGVTRLARWLAIAVLTGGLLASILAAQDSRLRHTREVTRIFAAEVESMRNSVARQIDLFMDVLESIGQLHELSDRISVEDFEEFAVKGLQFQLKILNAYGFVQRMPHELRSAIERGDGGLKLTEPDGTGRFVPARERPEYFILVHQRPTEALAFPLGADLAALPGVPEAILRMHMSGEPALARGLRLQDKDGSLGFFVFAPLYQGGRPNQSVLSGFTVTILWPRQILDRALADVAVRDVLIRFNDPEIFPDTPSGGEEHGITLVQNIPVVDRMWRFEAVASPEYLAARRSVLPTVILFGGSAVTLLLAATIALLSGRTRIIEKTVAERTGALQEANRMLSDAMHERMRLEAEILEISEREKQMVGQDLHDSLGQKLTGAVFLSKALVRLAEGADAQISEQARHINEVLKESVAQVRRMARGLSPVDLGHEGLGGALQRLAEETSSVYSISCLFRHPDASPAPPARTAHHLYAVAMEAVNNAIRHGHATEVMIEWHHHQSELQLTIEDNGSGFDPSATMSGGLGLRIMRYRATMMGGYLDIQRRPGGGMMITLQLRDHAPLSVKEQLTGQINA